MLAALGYAHQGGFCTIAAACLRTASGILSLNAFSSACSAFVRGFLPLPRRFQVAGVHHAVLVHDVLPLAHGLNDLAGDIALVIHVNAARHLDHARRQFLRH